MPAVALATGRATLAGQVEGDGPYERGYPGPPGYPLSSSERIEYPTTTKDYGFDIWHMERSDHAAAREDDGDSR